MHRQAQRAAAARRLRYNRAGLGAGRGIRGGDSSLFFANAVEDGLDNFAGELGVLQAAAHRQASIGRASAPGGRARADG
jgi:hypothetical protein